MEHVRRAMPLLRDLGSASLELYRELATRNEFDFDWTTRGLLTLYRTERGRANCEEEAEHAHHLGVAATLLNRAGLQQLEPHVEIRADGGLYFPDDCHLTPSKFVVGLAKHLEANGVRLLTNTMVSGFKVQGNRVVEATMSSGSLKADEFVLAGGSWSPKIVRSLGIRLPMEAGKGYSITYECKDGKPRIPLILTEARVAVTPMGNTLRFAGTMEIAGLDLSITKRRVDAILLSLKNYFGGFDNLRASEGEVWAGLRPVSPDGLPYIGRFKSYSNLIAATGHAMIGVSLAPVTGKLVAEIATNEMPSFDLSLLNPDRFS
jgi:D-amino-acid dehydrogenase